MDFKKNIEKIPGGMMVIPLIAGAIINTLGPAKLEDSDRFEASGFTPFASLRWNV